MKKAIPFILLAAGAGAAWYFLIRKKPTGSTTTSGSSGSLTPVKHYTPEEIAMIKKVVAGRGA